NVGDVWLQQMDTHTTVWLDIIIINLSRDANLPSIFSCLIKELRSQRILWMEALQGTKLVNNINTICYLDYNRVAWVHWMAHMGDIGQEKEK
ncbi:hypothetical protein ACJX0J_025425, partial [Zea mays]